MSVPRPTVGYQQEWVWEGQVVGLVVRHLSEPGASVRSVADTATKARGTDMVATLDGRVLHIEGKGWPSTQVRGPGAGARAEAHSSVDAGQALDDRGRLQRARLRAKHDDDRVIVAFPAFPRYVNLADEVAPVLARADIEIWFVREDGEVSRR